MLELLQERIGSLHCIGPLTQSVRPGISLVGTSGKAYTYLVATNPYKQVCKYGSVAGNLQSLDSRRRVWHDLERRRLYVIVIHYSFFQASTN